MLPRILAIIGLSIFLQSCGSVDFTALQPATLSGRVFVMWVGEGNSAGDGTFLFVPDPKNPLTFRRRDQTAPGAIIQPGLMYTDGGSIPSVAQVFNGFHPWGYAPAYMVHDWLFTARHCIVDGQDSPKYDQVRSVSFDDSAAILGEAISGLVEQHQVKKNDIAGGAITTAVDSSVARNLWDQKGGCAALQVSPADMAAAEAAIPGSTHASVMAAFRIPLNGKKTAVRPAKIVAAVQL